MTGDFDTHEPSPRALEDARALAADLCDIATGAKTIQGGYINSSNPPPLDSASDRLIAVAARLGAITQLLSRRYVPKPQSADQESA